ncbi:MAG: sensor histidine kinase [Dehalococcoidia bacterium]
MANTALAAQPLDAPSSGGRVGPLVSSFTVLFATRFPAWLIALAVVITDTRPSDNLRHEPWLLIATFLLVAFGTAYVPVIRPSLSRALDFELTGRRDLMVLAAIDMAIVLGVLWASGGLNTPYYHFAIMALLVPVFLVGWTASLVVLAGFLAAMVLIWSNTGGGIEVWTARAQLGGAVPGLLITPVLVVVVARYMAWLAGRLDRAYERTRLALDDTETLYEVARAVAAGDPATELAQTVTSGLADTGRFSRLVICGASEGSLRALADTAGATDSTTAAFVTVAGGGDAPQHRLRLEADGTSTDLEVLPLLMGDRLLGALAFEASEPLRPTDSLLLVAVAEQLASAFARLELAAEKDVLVAAEERARIAREIHDGVAQSLYMLTLHLDKTATLVEDDPVLGERIRLLLWMSREALVEVRQYIFDLKPLLTGQTSLTQTIRDQAAEFSRIAGIAIEIEALGEERELPVAARGALFRVVQEAFANAYRHGDAKHVDVRVAFEPHELAIDIADDGRGFTPSEVSGGGFGLRNMRERLDEVGGSVNVESEPGRGARIEVRVPLAAPALVD